MRRVLLALLLVACGDGRGVPDGPAPDGDDARGLVTVQFLTGDASAGGLEVYFQNADSSLVLATRTLADGSANAFMASGGFVTVATSSTLWTFSDVQIGDHLVIDLRLAFSAAAQTTFRLRLPPEPLANSIQLVTTCGSADVTPAQQAPFTVGLGICDPAIDMLAVAYPLNGFEPVSYMYRDAVVLVPGMTTTLESTYHPTETSTIDVTSAPFVGVRALQSLVGSHGTLLSVLATSDTQDGAVTLAAAIPQPAGTRLVTDAWSLDFTQAQLQHVVRWAPVTAHTAIDLAEQVYPLTSTPSYDPTSSTIRWTEAPVGREPNAVLAALTFDFSNSWWIAAPRGAEPVIHVPVLPGGVHQPHQQISVFQLVNIADDDGYAQVRQRLAGWQVEQPWPITGSTGHVVYSELSGFGPLDP